MLSLVVAIILPFAPFTGLLIGRQSLKVFEPNTDIMSYMRVESVEQRRSDALLVAQEDQVAADKRREALSAPPSPAPGTRRRVLFAPANSSSLTSSSSTWSSPWRKLAAPTPSSAPLMVRPTWKWTVTVFWQVTKVGDNIFTDRKVARIREVENGLAPSDARFGQYCKTASRTSSKCEDFLSATKFFYPSLVVSLERSESTNPNRERTPY